MVRVALLILAALGLGLFAGVGTYVVQENNREQALAEYEKVLVLFAAEEVPEGTTLFEAITKNLVTYELFPEALLPATALLETGDVDSDSRATKSLPAGTLVLEGDFQVSNEILESTYIPARHAAVSLSLTSEQRGGGLIKPGSNVGVVSTQFDPETDLSQTEVLFSSIEVLALNGEMDTGGLLAADQSNREITVTLAVPESSVGKLLDAYANGEITLVLLVADQTLPISQGGQ